MKTIQMGSIAEVRVMLRCAQLGYAVSLPVSTQRYDMVIDKRGKLYRVQVKWTSHKTSTANGSYQVELRRWNDCSHREKTRTYHQSEIDALIVYLADVDKICWIPASEVEGKMGIVLRVIPSANNQKKGIRLVDDYEF